MDEKVSSSMSDSVPESRVLVANEKLSDDDYHALNHHEDNVINHRLTWLLAGQPLLFLAYVTAAVKDPVDNNTNSIQQTLLEQIPLLGILMSVLIFAGILGAAFAMWALASRRASSGAGVTTPTTILGMVPPLTIPIVLCWVWWSIRKVAVATLLP